MSKKTLVEDIMLIVKNDSKNWDEDLEEKELKEFFEDLEDQLILYSTIKLLAIKVLFKSTVVIRNINR